VKYLLPYLIVFGALVGLAFAHWEPGSGLDEKRNVTRLPDYTWEEMRAIDEEAARVEERARGVFRCHSFLEEIKDQLRAGKLSLADAADALHEAARRDNSGFLRSLDWGFPDSAFREKFALVLLGHLREELRGGAVPGMKVHILEELSCDLTAWPEVSAATLDALCEAEAEASAPAYAGAVPHAWRRSEGAQRGW